MLRWHTRNEISYFAGLRVRVPRCGCESRDAVAGREMRVAGREMWVAGCEMRVAGHEMRVASREMRVAIAKCIGNSLAYAYGVSMAYLCNSFVLSGIDFIFGMVLV